MDTNIFKSKMIDFWDIEKDTYLINENGEVKNVKTNHVLKWHENINGYYKVVIKTTNGYKKMFVHRLVAKAFIPTDNDKQEVNHLDGDKSRNCANNLEWCGRQRNVKHAFDMGLNMPKKGSENCNAVHDEATIHEVCKLLEKGMETSQIIEKLELDNKKKRAMKMISDVRSGRGWTHISAQYEIENTTKHKGFQRGIANLEETVRICELIKDGTLTNKEIAVQVFGNEVELRQIHLVRDIRGNRRARTVSKNYW